jgi:hypothetical protein
MEFIQNTTESVLIDNVEKSCKNVIFGNWLSLSEIEGAERQKEIRNIFSLYFVCNRTINSSNKNVITAYIGPHRGEHPDKEFFKKLNGN